MRPTIAGILWAVNQFKKQRSTLEDSFQPIRLLYHCDSRNRRSQTQRSSFQLILITFLIILRDRATEDTNTNSSRSRRRHHLSTSPRAGDIFVSTSTWPGAHLKFYSKKAWMVLCVASIILSLLALICVQAITGFPSSGPLSSTASTSASKMASAGVVGSASTLTLVRQRAKAAILGGFVADAATMPLHWIYDRERIEILLKEAQLSCDRPEFYPKPACPFYQYSLGSLSPYGDELVPLLRHLTSQGARGFDSRTFAKESAAFFKSYTGRLSHVPKLFLEATEAGKEGDEAAAPDSQAHGIIKVPLLVARYAGSPDLLPRVTAAVRVHQCGDESAAASVALARVLEHVVLTGTTTKEAIQAVLTHADRHASRALGAAERAILETALAAQYPDPDVIKKFGWSCALPGALQGSLYVAAHAPDYTSGVRFSIMAGGDNCSRNIVIGALLAAQNPKNAIPAEWIAKTRPCVDVEALADKIVGELAI